MGKSNTGLSNLKNIGPTTAGWLAAIGVHTRADLERLGPVAAYRILKGHGYNVSLVLVYALAGALSDCHWNRLPAGLKTQLKNAAAAEPAARRRRR